MGRAETGSGMTIVGGAISGDQQSVELRLQDGRTLHRANLGHFGFDGLHISPGLSDRQLERALEPRQ